MDSIVSRLPDLAEAKEAPPLQPAGKAQPA